MMNNTIVQWLIGLGISGAFTLGISALARYYPKQKAIELANKWGDIVGPAISKFGNSKVGKKIWNKVEEGPIVTALAFVMAFCVRVGSTMLADNINEVVSGGQNASIQQSECEKTK